MNDLTLFTEILYDDALTVSKLKFNVHPGESVLLRNNPVVTFACIHLQVYRMTGVHTRNNIQAISTKEKKKKLQILVFYFNFIGIVYLLQTPSKSAKRIFCISISKFDILQ